MVSANALTFSNRMLHYKADLELMDILCSINQDKGLAPEDNSLLFFNLDSQKHKTLKGRKRNDHNRNMALNHLRQTVYGAFIKSLYEEFYRYLRATIKETVKNLKADPDRLIGEHKIQLSAKEILKLGNMTAVNEIIIDTLFQTLEAEKSTIKLIEKIRDKLGLKFDEALIDGALPYLELRHKLVHAEGKLDKDFVEKYPQIPRDGKGYADLDLETMENALSAVSKLVEAIDEDALKKNFVRPNTPAK